MPAPQVIDPFHRTLDAMVREQMDQRMVRVCGGLPTFSDYNIEVGYLRALQDVLNWSMEISRQRHGDSRPPGAEDQ